MANLPHITEFSRVFTGEYWCLHLSSHQIWAIFIFWKTCLKPIFKNESLVGICCRQVASKLFGGCCSLFEVIRTFFGWIHSNSLNNSLQYTFLTSPEASEGCFLAQFCSFFIRQNTNKKRMRSVFQNIKMAQIWCEDRWIHEYSPVKARENSVMWGKFVMPV